MLREVRGQYFPHLYVVGPALSAPGASVVLVPEPDNEHDPLALALLDTTTGQHCGYLGYQGLFLPMVQAAAAQDVQLTATIGPSGERLGSGLPEYDDMTPRDWRTGWCQISRLRIHGRDRNRPIREFDPLTLSRDGDWFVIRDPGGDVVGRPRRDSDVDRGAPAWLDQVMTAHGWHEVPAVARLVGSAYGRTPNGQTPPLWVAVVNYGEGVAWRPVGL